MATAEELLITALEGDAAVQTHVGATPASRIYPLVLPQKPTLPAVSFQRIANARVNSFDAGGGIDNPRLQVDCWAVTRKAARELALEVKRVVEAATAFGGWLVTDHEFFEDDVEPKLYRVSMDASFWTRDFTPAPTGIYTSGPPTSPSSHSVNSVSAGKPFVNGALVRIAWEYLEPTTQGVYDWSLLDEELDRADSFKTKVALAVTNGPSKPSWLEDAGAVMFTYTFKGVLGTKMPVPWDSVYLTAWTNFVAALGARYNSRDTVTLVHMTHSTYNGFEMQLGPGLTGHDDWVAAGYTDALEVGSWQTVITAFKGAFPSKPLDVEVHPIFRLESEAPGVAASVVDYGNTMIGQRFGVFAAWFSQYHAVSVYPEMWALMQQAVKDSSANVQFIASATDSPERFTNVDPTDPLVALTGAVDLALASGVRYMEIWSPSDIQNAVFADKLTATALAIQAI